MLEIIKADQRGHADHGWLQVVKGALEINGESLNASDGAAISEEKLIKIHALEDNTEFILFDLA